MSKNILCIFVASMAVLLSACGSAATPTSTSSKPVDIKVESNPNPAMMGDLELILSITDVNGNPLEDATVDVSADHTGHSGMNMSGVATEQSAGKYAINANFSMSGTWLLTVYVRKGEIDYKEEIDFQVQ